MCSNVRQNGGHQIGAPYRHRAQRLGGLAVSGAKPGGRPAGDCQERNDNNRYPNRSLHRVSKFLHIRRSPSGLTTPQISESTGVSTPAGRHVYSGDRMRAKAPSGATCERNMPPRWGFRACAVACSNHGAPDGALSLGQFWKVTFMRKRRAPFMGVEMSFKIRVTFSKASLTGTMRTGSTSASAGFHWTRSSE